MKNLKKPKQQSRKSIHKVSNKQNKPIMANEEFFELLFGKPTRTISLKNNNAIIPQETIAMRFLKDSKGFNFKKIVEKHTSQIKEWRTANNIPTPTSSENKEELTHRNVLSVGTFFSGAGAPEYALSEANIAHANKYVVEINKYCRETLIKNHNPKLVFEDIKSVSACDLPDVDLICFGSPCQDISKSNNNGKGLYGEKSKYFFEAYRLLKAKMPKYLIFENVEGLMSSNNGEDFKTVLRLFKELNYEVSYKVINPVDLGGCTTRRRVFFVLIRKDIGIKFNFPKNDKSTKCINDCLITNVEHTYFDKSEFIPWHKPLEEQIRGVLRKDYKWKGSKRDEKTRVYNKYSKCPTIQRDCKVFVNDGVGIRYLLKEELKELQGFKDNLDLTMLPDSEYKSQLGNTMEVETMKKLLLEIERINNLHIQQTKNIKVVKDSAKKVRKSKFISKSNNNINIVKNICNVPDLDYIITKEEIGKEYMQHLKNGGTITMTINKSKNNTEKKNNIIDKKYIVSVDSLKMLGFRNKTQRRFKIIGSIDIIENIGKSDVLVSRNGGKNKFDTQIKQGLSKLNKEKHTTVIDGFVGGGSFTLKNIETMKFDNWIINDLDKYVATTFVGVKKDYKTVINTFLKLNSTFDNMIPQKFRTLYKNKKENENEIAKLRLENIHIKTFYKNLISEMEQNINTYSEAVIAGIYIFIINKTTGGMLKYFKNGSINNTSFSWEISKKCKVNMIKYWSYLLNKYNVEISNKCIFEVLDSSNSNSTIYSDSPYFFTQKKGETKTGVDYGFDASVSFQQKLINKLDKFDTVLYSNENCEDLYKLGVDKHFENYITFERTNNGNHKSSTIGGEFLGYRSKKVSEIEPNHTELLV